MLLYCSTTGSKYHSESDVLNWHSLRTRTYPEPLSATVLTCRLVTTEPTHEYLLYTYLCYTGVYVTRTGHKTTKRLSSHYAINSSPFFVTVHTIMHTPLLEKLMFESYCCTRYAIPALFHRKLQFIHAFKYVYTSIYSIFRSPTQGEGGSLHVCDVGARTRAVPFA